LSLMKTKKNKEIADFLTRRCREMKLSFRSLSLNAGLSPSTVHNIVSGKSRPNVLSLNAIADYLEVKRTFLWRMAGLLGDNNGEDLNIVDPRVKFLFAQVDKMPDNRKEFIIRVIETVITNMKLM